jgi:hypothetical protein
VAGDAMEPAKMERELETAKEEGLHEVPAAVRKRQPVSVEAARAYANALPERAFSDVSGCRLLRCCMGFAGCKRFPGCVCGCVGMKAMVETTVCDNCLLGCLGPCGLWCLPLCVCERDGNVWVVKHKDGSRSLEFMVVDDEKSTVAAFPGRNTPAEAICYCEKC